MPSPRNEEDAHNAATKSSTLPTSSLIVGGTKGHIVESIDGSLLRLHNAYRWKVIPNCTGRYTCRDHDVVAALGPPELLRQAGIGSKSTIIVEGKDAAGSMLEFKEWEFVLPGRTDRVLVVSSDENNATGLITYMKVTQDGTRYVHTLNTVSGFRRKLEAIGIVADDSNISYVDS